MLETMPVSKIRQRTVVGQVMNEIRDLIASGAYSPGDRIPTEKELAERFGIGRSSVREAIKIFNYLGVLNSKAAIGTFVQERSSISSEALTWSLLLGRDELEEVIDLRSAIELRCIIGLVRGYADDSEPARGAVLELAALIEDMDNAIRLRSADFHEKLIEDDYQFHYAIIRSSENPLFISIYETLRAFLKIEISKSQNDYENPVLILEEHREIRDSIVGGDQNQAIRTHLAHIENIKRRIRP